MLVTPLSPEFDLLAACCRWPIAKEIVWEKGRLSIDWSLFESLVKRHRVAGLVNYALRLSQVDLPTHVSTRLAANAERVAHRSLRQAAEAHRLLGLLSERGVDPTFLKGSALACIAYGSLALKEAFDIDILIPVDQVPAAISALRQGGYSCAMATEISDAQLEAWAMKAKDTTWRHDDGHMVELHTRPFANNRLMQDLSARPRTLVSISHEKALPTLGRVDTAVYLGVHGAVHGWSRLKWLADANALIIRLGVEELRGVWNLGKEKKVERAVAQMFLLTRDIFGTSYPFAIIDKLANDRAVRIAAQASLGAMRGSGPTELDDQTFGTVKLNIVHFIIQRGWRYKLSEVRAKVAQLDSPGDREHSGSIITKLVTALPRWILRRHGQKRRLKQRAANGRC
jgi:hypothetical protein